MAVQKLKNQAGADVAVFIYHPENSHDFFCEVVMDELTSLETVIHALEDIAQQMQEDKNIMEN